MHFSSSVLPLTSIWKNNSYTMGHEGESESRSVVSDSLRLHELYSPWNPPGQNTGMGSLSLLYGIFLTQRSNPGIELGSPTLEADALTSEPPGKPLVYVAIILEIICKNYL